jgi:hypothetical protein
MSGELTTVQDPQNWATVQSLQTAAPLVICNNIPCVCMLQSQTQSDKCQTSQHNSYGQVSTPLIKHNLGNSRPSLWALPPKPWSYWCFYTTNWGVIHQDFINPLKQHVLHTHESFTHGTEYEKVCSYLSNSGNKKQRARSSTPCAPYDMDTTKMTKLPKDVLQKQCFHRHSKTIYMHLEYSVQVYTKLKWSKSPQHAWAKCMINWESQMYPRTEKRKKPPYLTKDCRQTLWGEYCHHDLEKLAVHHSHR